MYKQQTQERRGERGSVLVVVTISLVAMVALGSITILTVRSGLSSTTHDRFKAIALFAAEAGVAVGLNYLRQQHAGPSQHWSALVTAENSPLVAPPGFPGEGAKPGEVGNLFSPGMEAWYEVRILNNRDDGAYDSFLNKYAGYASGNDTDGHIILQVTGHGPNNAAALIEVEISPRQSLTPLITSGANNSGNQIGAGPLTGAQTPGTTPL